MAHNKDPIYLLADDKREKMIDIVTRTQPDDEFEFNNLVENDMLNLWWKEGTTKFGIPSDIFFDGNVCCTDCIIKRDGFDPFRVIIHNNYKNRIRRKNTAEVGILVYSLDRYEGGERITLIAPIRVKKCTNYILLSPICFIGIHEYINEYIKQHTWNLIRDIVGECISVWYSLQLTLMHPSFNPLFTISTNYAINTDGTKTPRKKKRIKSIASPRMKKLSWYVSGHWRHYSSGIVIYIKGYWKGPLRHLKREISEGDKIDAKESNDNN